MLISQGLKLLEFPSRCLPGFRDGNEVDQRWPARAPAPVGGGGTVSLGEGAGGGARGALTEARAAEPGRVGTYPRRPFPAMMARQ